MAYTYWNQERKDKIKIMAKEKHSLAEIAKCFPSKSAMEILFVARSISYLGDVPCKDKEAVERMMDSSLSKRDKFIEANRRWESGDNLRLKSFFKDRINIRDICSSLGRSYTALVYQMDKLYPTPKEKETLFSEIAFFIRCIPVTDKIT